MSEFRYKGSTFEEIEEVLARCSCWDEWLIFADDFFDPGDWPEAAVAEDARNETVVIDGIEWRVFWSPYAIDPRISLMSDKASYKAFQKFEPEAAAENDRNPERYGAYCYHCVRMTQSNKFEFCPACGFELVKHCLNTD